MKNSRQIQLFTILVAVVILCAIFIYTSEKGFISVISKPSISNETYTKASIAPGQSSTFGSLNIVEELVSFSSPGEIPSVNLTLIHNNQKKSIWVDQDKSIEVFGYLIHILRVDMAEGNVELAITKLLPM